MNSKLRIPLCWKDLDGEAMSHGCEFQKVGQASGIHCSSDFDVTSVAQQLARWQTHPPAPDEIDGAIREASAPLATALPGQPYDVVASVGLLSQLLEIVDASLGTQHPRFLPVLSAIRLQHLRRLLELTRAGGRAWLFWEVVSSLTCPELLQVPQSDLMPVLQRAIAQHNFFTGANPAVVQRLFKEAPSLTELIATIETPRPWLWTFFGRSYAVCSVGSTRKG